MRAPTLRRVFGSLLVAALAVGSLAAQSKSADLQAIEVTTAGVAMLSFRARGGTEVDMRGSERMFAAFGKAGGRARFELLPPLRTERTQDGHDLLFVGRDIWEPIVFPWLDANAK